MKNRRSPNRPTGLPQCASHCTCDVCANKQTHKQTHKHEEERDTRRHTHIVTENPHTHIQTHMHHVHSGIDHKANSVNDRERVRVSEASKTQSSGSGHTQEGEAGTSAPMGHSLDAGMVACKLARGIGDAPGPPSVRKPNAPPSSSGADAIPGVSSSQ